MFSKYRNRIKIEEKFSLNNQNVNPIDKYGDGEFIYVDINSIENGRGTISFDQKVVGNNAPSRAKRVSKDKTVIISTVRPYLKGFAYLEKEVSDAVYSTGFALIESNDEEEYIPKLLYYFFMFSDDLMNQMEAKMPKASYPSINLGDIKDFTIPDIPSNEQKKILSEIEELEKNIHEQELFLEGVEEEKRNVLSKYLEE